MQTHVPLSFCLSKQSETFMHQNSLMGKQFKSHPDCCNLLPIKPPCLDVNTWVCLAIGPVHLVIVVQQVIVALVETLGAEGGRRKNTREMFFLLGSKVTSIHDHHFSTSTECVVEEINVCAFVGVEGGGVAVCIRIHPTQRDVENNTGESSQSMW